MSEIGRPRPTNPGKRLAAEAVADGWPILRFASRGTPGWPYGANVGSFLVAAPVTTTAAAAAGHGRQPPSAPATGHHAAARHRARPQCRAHRTAGEPNLDGLPNEPAVVVAASAPGRSTPSSSPSCCGATAGSSSTERRSRGSCGRHDRPTVRRGVRRPASTSPTPNGCATTAACSSAARRSCSSKDRSTGPTNRRCYAAVHARPAGAAVPIVPLVVRDSDRL